MSLEGLIFHIIKYSNSVPAVTQMWFELPFAVWMLTLELSENKPRIPHFHFVPPFCVLTPSVPLANENQYFVTATLAQNSYFSAEHCQT